MSNFLDGDAVAQLSQALGQAEESGVYEAQTDSTTEEYQTEPRSEESAEAGEEVVDESGHRVPYSRFQKVLHTRNNLRDENDALKAQLESLDKQGTSAPSYEHDYERQSSEDEEIDKIYQQLLSEEQSEYGEPTSYQGEDAPWKSRVESLEGKLWEFEVDKAQVNLQREIDTAIGSYPRVPQEFLVQSVIQDPDTDVMDVAERYSAFIAGVEEGAIARYSDEQPQVNAPPPRPSARSTTAARTHVSSGRETRGNSNSVTEAGQAALRWLKDNT